MTVRFFYALILNTIMAFEVPSMLNAMISRSLTELINQRQRSLKQTQQIQRSIYDFALRNSANFQSPQFQKISSADLGMLFQITDEQIFDGLLGQLCESSSEKPLSFRLSTRMTTCGGMTTMQRENRRGALPEFEIAIATGPLFDTFKIDTAAKVGGLVCHNRLQALQRIMEHEMLHLAELLLFSDSNCNGTQFKNYARRHFGHTESNHRLLTPRDVARRKLGISSGDTVCFDVGGRSLTGIINRITKRATVLVADPKGTKYTDGKRYSKFYVPLNMLRRK